MQEPAALSRTLVPKSQGVAWAAAASRGLGMGVRANVHGVQLNRVTHDMLRGPELAGSPGRPK